VQAELAEYHGAVVNHNLVRSIMREHGMHGLPAHRTRRKPAGRHLATTVDLSRRVKDAGLAQSFGSIGDGYDNAMRLLNGVCAAPEIRSSH